MYYLFYKFDSFTESYIGFGDYLLTAIVSLFVAGVLCVPILLATMMYQGAKAPVAYDARLDQQFKIKSRPFFCNCIGYHPHHFYKNYGVV